MASLAYISVPPSASRLQGDPSTIQRAKRVLTSLPTSSPTSSPAPGSSSSNTGGSSLSSASIPSSLTSPTAAAFSLLPQMLLSSTLPPSSSGSKEKEKSSIGTTSAPLLLTTRDPLSLPTTSANFKRFVSKAGPIFWFQDRVEEVVMWRRGWRITGVWIAVYVFFCYFPKMVFAIPHMALIGIMLASYPYPDPNTAASSTTSAPPPTQQSDSVNWQANLQAIQNLMGFVADTHDLIQPHVHHLLLSPAHIPATPTSNSTPTGSSHAQPSSPYPPYILLALIVTFPPLIILLSSSYFPARTACLVAGLAPLIATHPRVRPLLVPLSQLASASAMDIGQQALTILIQRYREFRSFASRVGLAGSTAKTQLADDGGLVLPPLQTILERLKDDDRLDDVCWRAEMREVELWENERYTRRPGPGVNPSSRSSIDGTADLPSYPHGHDSDPHISALQQTRHTRPASDSPDAKQTTELHRLSLRAHQSVLAHPVPHPADAAWSKTNLRPGDRRAWTRGRDGWGGIQPRRRAGSEGSLEKQDTSNCEREAAEEGQESGAVSSNLTFSLAPGWAFVCTEGWRRDRTRAWADFDGDSVTRQYSPDADGWVYTNDVWGDAHPAPYPGSVTRRRRWIRRVWFDGSHQAAVQQT